MPNVDRRNFLKLVGAGGVGAGAGFMLSESRKHPVEHLVPYPVPPEEFSPGIATWYNSVCSMCSAGCGISVRTREGRAKKIEGNPAHPVSQGRLCALGQSGLQALYNPDRITGPLVRAGRRGEIEFDPTTWDESFAELANQLELMRTAGRGGGVALLTGGVRGHLASLLELFMGWLGSDQLLHYDFNHPATLYAANERFFGESNLPYYDIENSRYVLSFGADFIGHWLSPVHHGLGFGRSRQARDGDRGRFVQIEPRMSLTGAAADEWIAANPGTEGVLALGIARRIVDQGGYQGTDLDAWQAALAGYAPDAVAEQTGVLPDTVARLADSFAETQPGLAIGGGATANHSNGVDALVAVNALNHLVGNIGVEGGVIFNPPPAFGPEASRHASLARMLELAEDARAGRIELLIVSNTNPVFNLPEASGFAEALADIPQIVSLSSFLDETTAHADLVLPSNTYLESWGDDTPSPGVGFRVGAVSQPVVEPLYDTRATGDIVLELAHRMGLDLAFPWPNMEEYLKYSWREVWSSGTPDPSIPDFDTFWTSVVRAGVWGDETRAPGGEFVPDAGVVEGIGVGAPEFAGAEGEFPYALHPYLSNGLHDGRGANLPWMQELPDALTGVVYGTWIELNPVTADELGLSDGDVVAIESPAGAIEAPVLVYPAIMPGVVAMPIGQGHEEYGRYAEEHGVNPINVLAAQTEPDTGALAWAATRVRLVPTGGRADLVRVSGEARELGREIVQIADAGTPAAAVNAPAVAAAGAPGVRLASGARAAAGIDAPTAGAEAATANTRLNSIPITVVNT